MKFGALVGCIVGLGLSAWLLESYGVGRILAVLSHAGWLGILAVIAFHPLQMLFSALGWREIAGSAAPRRGLAKLCGLALGTRGSQQSVAAGANRRRVGRIPLVAPAWFETCVRNRRHRRRSVDGDGVPDLFTLIGLAILLTIVGDNSGIATYVIVGLLVAALLTACLFGALWFGFASVVEKGLMRLGRSHGLGWSRPCRGSATGVDGMLPPCQAGLAGCLSPGLLAARRSGGVPRIAFSGDGCRHRPGLVIESLGQALKTLGFAVPGALGIQEGGYIIVCRVFGLSPEVAIGLSLMKRLREIVMGLPGLIIWHFEEGSASADRAESRAGGPSMIGASWTHLLARVMVRPLIGTWVRPNHLTTLRLATGMAACALFASVLRRLWGGAAVSGCSRRSSIGPTASSRASET